MKMRHFSVICIAVLGFALCGCAGTRLLMPAADDPLEWSENLVERDGRWYARNSAMPFTGWDVGQGGHAVMACRDGYKIFDPPPSIQTNHPSGSAMAELFSRKGSLNIVRNWVRQHGPSHDNYSFFEEHGTVEDVPMLLYGLKSMGEDAKGPWPCVRGHCLDALNKITGARPGNNYSDWAKWWRDKYKSEPPDWKPEKK